MTLAIIERGKLRAPGIMHDSRKRRMYFNVNSGVIGWLDSSRSMVPIPPVAVLHVGSRCISPAYKAYNALASVVHCCGSSRLNR